MTKDAKSQLVTTQRHLKSAVDCWSCKSSIIIAELLSNDGLCPFCDSEIDLEEDCDD